LRAILVPDLKSTGGTTANGCARQKEFRTPYIRLLLGARVAGDSLENDRFT